MNLYPYRFHNMSVRFTLEHGLFEPLLPEHCKPSNAFLLHLSSVFHTCIPTPLAFISTLLGTLSIVAWLFAQLPQIWKNYRLHSTSGLSIFFLGEWLLGDMSNLIGSILTRQASWQVVLASYYCFVDILLVCQWFWYELLKHGRPLRSIWRKSRETKPHGKGSIPEIVEGVSVHRPSDDSRSTSSKPIDAKRLLPPRHNNLFRMPRYSPPVSPSISGSPSSVSSQTPRYPIAIRSGTSPMPSPRTVLLISMVVCILVRPSSASPLSSPSTFANPLSAAPQSPHKALSEAVGQLFSWLSTVCYLGSRIPQLVKNHARRSTSGLSRTLFAAAFTGNLFYASSLLTNPCAWRSMGPHGGRGWAGSHGSEQGAWVALAAPFFLGAAGVLALDAMVGAQFWWFGEGRARARAAAEAIVVVEADAGGEEGVLRTWRWRRVDGWMRGWFPSVSVAGTPIGSNTPSRGASQSPAPGERRALLEGQGGKGRAYGAA